MADNHTDIIMIMKKGFEIWQDLLNGDRDMKSANGVGNMVPAN